MKDNAIFYKKEKVEVANQETLDLFDVTEIPEEFLFVSLPDVSSGKRYAFDIRELENSLERTNDIRNFYANSPFTKEEMEELIDRSPKIKQFATDCLEKNKNHNQITDNTLKEIDLFLKNVRLDFTYEKEALELAKTVYNEEDLAILLEERPASVIARGIAFQRFKSYYEKLSEKEKSAINDLPGIREYCAEHFFSVKSGSGEVDDIFKLKGESCVGGASDVFDKVVKAVELIRGIGEAIKSENNKSIDDKIKPENELNSILNDINAVKESVDNTEITPQDGIEKLDALVKKARNLKTAEDSIEKVEEVKQALSNAFDYLDECQSLQDKQTDKENFQKEINSIFARIHQVKEDVSTNKIEPSVGINQLEALVNEAKNLKGTKIGSTEAVEKELSNAFDYVEVCEDHQSSQRKFTPKLQESLPIVSEEALQEEKDKILNNTNNTKFDFHKFYVISVVEVSALFIDPKNGNLCEVSLIAVQIEEIDVRSKGSPDFFSKDPILNLLNNLRMLCENNMNKVQGVSLGDV